MEENRKGPGVFYAVVGVATLVVAIIGATFAYFASTTNGAAGAAAAQSALGKSDVRQVDVPQLVTVLKSWGATL